MRIKRSKVCKRSSIFLTYAKVVQQIRFYERFYAKVVQQIRFYERF